MFMKLTRAVNALKSHFGVFYHGIVVICRTLLGSCRHLTAQRQQSSGRIKKNQAFSFVLNKVEAARPL